MFKTIRWKLTLWYAGLLVITLIILEVTLYQAFQHSLMAEAIDTVMIRAQQISSFIEAPEGEAVGEGTFIDITDPDLVKKFSSEGVYIEIRDAQGQLVNRSFLLGEHHLNEGTLISKLKSAGSGVLELRHLPGLGRMIVCTLRLQRNGRAMGTVQVGRSLQFVDGVLDRLQLLLLFISGGGILLAVGVGATLARTALAPIDSITKTARQISAGALNQRLSLKGPDDELTRLANAFNEMLDRLEEAFQRERQFIADVSHELRTPLTVIKGTAEVVLRKRSEGTEEYREALQSIKEETDRMAKILDSLLTLARADSGQIEFKITKVDLSALAQKICKRFFPLAKEKRIDLKLKCPASLEVNGDAERLEQVLENLLENALKYTPSEGQIELDLEKEGNWAILAVSDTGIGIPEEDLPHIFDRFYRVDRARSREEGGAGLGLAIVKWIVEAHGGRIDVQSQVGQGTRFLIRLPTYPLKNPDEMRPRSR